MSFSPSDIQLVKNYFDGTIITFGAFLGLGVFFVGLRLYARWTSLERKSWGWDDYLILPALLSLIIHISAEIASQYCDMRLNIAGLMNDNAANAHYIVLSDKFQYVYSLASQLATALPKLSLCCLFLRFQNGNLERRITVATMIFLATNCIAFFVSFALQCIPLNWLHLASGHCLKLFDLEICRQISHIFSDLVMLLLPIPTIRKLQITTTRKVGLVITFTTGSVGLVTCIARMVYYIKYFRSTQFTIVNDDYDLHRFLFYNRRINLLTVLEPTTYFIAANLPPLRSPIARMLKTVTNFAEKHHFSHSLAKFKAKPQQWLQRLRAAEEADDPNSTEQAPTTSKRVRLGYIPTQQVSRFGEDMRTEIDRV